MRKKEGFICLDRQNAFWRMDSAMFRDFMSHVSDYFGVSNLETGFNLENVQFAEITGEDLSTVSAIFGGYSPDENRILLVPVHPQRFILPLKNSFDMYVFEKNSSEIRSICLKVK